MGVAATVAFAVAALMWAAAPAPASTFHVGSATALQAAVESADASSSPSTIELDAGQYLPGASLEIKRDITIIGPASSPGAVLGGSAVAPFPSDLMHVEARAKLTLWNVEVTGGGGEGTAAAVDDEGSVDIESSTLAGNTGPGLVVAQGASATVRNSTLSNGLAVAVVDDGSATLTNVTVALNRGGGIENRGTLALINTIVAENKGGDCEGHATTSDHSLDSDGSCGVGVLSRADPRLGRLAANGGPTPTQALEAGSPAIGAGDAAKCPSEDQRHLLRPSGTCDIGAYQTGASTPGGGGGAGGGGSGSAAPGLLRLSAHGTLRGVRHSRITFVLRVVVGHADATFSYRDAARRVVLARLTIGSVAFDAAHGEATLRGSVVRGGRRIHVTIVLVSHGRRGSLRLRLSGGYHESGSLTSGSILFTRT